MEQNFFISVIGKKETVLVRVKPALIQFSERLIYEEGESQNNVKASRNFQKMWKKLVKGRKFVLL